MKIKSDKLIEYLFYLFVFLLPWQTRWIVSDFLIGGEVWEYGRISIYGFDLVFVILLACYLVKSVKVSKCPVSEYPVLASIRQSSRSGSKSFVFLLLCFFAFMSILWADNKILSFYWGLRILQGITLVWLMSKINFSHLKLMASFVLSMGFSAALGIYQFLTQSAFASKWLGLAVHSATVLGQSVVEVQGERWLRAYGSLPHPNILGGFCLVALIFLAYYILKTQQGLFSQTNKKTKIIRLLLIIRPQRLSVAMVGVASYLLLITGAFFSFSRSAWLGLVLVDFIGSWILLKYGSEKVKQLVKRLWVYGTILFFIFIFTCWPLVMTRLNMGVPARLELKSNEQRLEGYSDAFDIIKSHPVLGVGLGNYTNELQKMYPDKPAWVYQPVHNIYLLILAELGMVGVLFAILLACYFIKSVKVLEYPVSKSFVFLFFCFFVFMFFFDHFWWTLPSGTLLVFLSVGWVISNK